MHYGTESPTRVAQPGTADFVALAICTCLFLLAGCDGVGTVCQTPGSTDGCGDDTICTFVRAPENLPPLSVCLKRCELSTDCSEGQVCRLVFCSDQQSSCQSGGLVDPPGDLCTGSGGSGGAGGAGGTSGSGGTGGMSGAGGTGGMTTSGCDSTANAFIKTLDPNDGFAETNVVVEDTTNLPDTWDRYSIELLIDAGLEGQLLQYGFSATASNFEDSAVFYDNIVVDPGPEFDEDFESLDQGSPTALGDAGWLVFGNVFEPDGETFIRGYGTDPAPNNSGAFSGIALDQGGPAQGDQVLVIISDYNNTEDQTVGNRVEANTFRERMITAGDVDNTIVFSFDAKRGNINAGCPTP